MTKETQETKISLAVALFDTLVALDDNADSDISDAAVASVVHGYMMAWLAMTQEAVTPAKPKQRRARRKKADIVAANAEVA